MPDYEVTDPNGIEYRPAGGGEAVHAKTGDPVLDADLTTTAREFLLRVGAIRLQLEGELQGMSRPDLDSQARDAGVVNPEGLANKAAVIAAIEEASANA